MARGTQHRKRRPQTNAGVAARTAGPPPKRPKRPAYEEQLFFGRLRNHAKPVFVVLAAVFVLSFVFLGVGSGSTGISQIVSNFFSGTSGSSTSLGSLQKKTVEHPKSAAAWLAYANKLQQDSKWDDAAAALTTYTKLRPKDTDQLSTLASLYLRRAQDWNTVYQTQQAYTQTLTPGSLVVPKSTSPLGKALATVTNPLASAVSAQTSTTTSNAYQQVLSYLSQRADGLQEDRRSSSRRTRPPSSSSRRRRRTRATRRRRSRPTRRSSSSRRATPRLRPLGRRSRRSWRRTRRSRRARSTGK